MRSLRARLAFACGAAVVIVVLVAGTLLVRTANADQYHQLDDSLARRLDAVRIPTVRIAQTGESGILGLAVQAIDDLVVRVMDGDRVRFDTGGAAGNPWPSVPDGIATVDAHGRTWRTLRRPVDLPSGPSDRFDVVVALPLEPTRETVENLRRNVALTGIVAIVVAAAAGWLLGTWVLRPLGRMRRAAEEVAVTTDLTRRVDPGRAPPELAGVVASMNAMLAQLEVAADQERHALETSRSFSRNVTHELRTPLTSLSTNLDVLRRHPDLDVVDRDALLVQDAGPRQVAPRSCCRDSRRWRAARCGRRSTSRSTCPRSWTRRWRRSGADTRHPTSRSSNPTRRPRSPAGPRDCGCSSTTCSPNAVVHGARDDGRAHVRVALAHEPLGVTLTVDDDGPGIPVASRAGVREPFTRGPNPRAPGSGLGLALVDQQVRLHGGTLELIDGPTGGTRVRVVMPVDQRCS